MVICADTSFLFSLYANDAHSRQAVAWVARCQQSLSVSPFNKYELGNALRFAEFRKLIPSGMAASYWAQFEAAITHNRLQMQMCNLAIVLAEAERLSSTYTLQQGHRSFDILHVAVARHIGATDFLTFDRNQSRLAQAEGLKVPKLH